ncbi:NADH dehydrogenase [Cytospora mali]|uniref:NADH dehydrogenase n=1 Tax=Cytospora mali TaxID=578113 RepID=A0A194UV71_CYTMA|nr:NADH dehydrogenase [Valsa mali var. pyri (nom. inval.)]
MFLRNIFSFLHLLALTGAAAIPASPATHDLNETSYDAIIVGGGPSGLSALSGLARVRRNVLLIDSGEYRNSATRHMHDVIGLDGITPAYFRWRARQLLADYDTVTMTNGTVTKIEAEKSDETAFTVQVTLPSGEEKTLSARKIVLATGLKDEIPSTPGLQENWGKGIYWCPWCDGHEHEFQPLGILSSLSSVAELVREVSTLNSDVQAFVNGTDTPEVRSAADADFPGWEDYLKIANVTVYNQTITSIIRLRDGLNASADPSLPSVPEYDLFRVDLDDGTSVERATFFVSFPDDQRSSVGADLGVTLYGNRLYADQSKGFLTNVPGVYAIGDANSNNITNVPSAMFTGKRAAVYLHVQLAREDVAAEISAYNAQLVARDMLELDPRDVWDNMNGELGDILYAGDFEN